MHTYLLKDKCVSMPRVRSGELWVGEPQAWEAFPSRAYCVLGPSAIQSFGFHQRLEQDPGKPDTGSALSRLSLVLAASPALCTQRVRPRTCRGPGDRQVPGQGGAQQLPSLPLSPCASLRTEGEADLSPTLAQESAYSPPPLSPCFSLLLLL